MEAFCVRCDKRFTADRIKQRFCSPACWYEARNKKATICKVCKWCGEGFKILKSQAKKKPMEFCSNDCLLSYRASNAKCQRAACQVCGCFTDNTTSICTTCLVRVDGARKVLYGIIAELTVSLRLMHCKECGTLLLDKQRAYCSDGCAWRANRRTRRARERNAFVERVELEVVARRDKWICHICSEPVYSNASYTRQPTLDHVIPLSKGGEHSYENIKLAHFSCNCSKHDSMPTEAN